MKRRVLPLNVHATITLTFLNFPSTSFISEVEGKLRNVSVMVKVKMLR